MNNIINNNMELYAIYLRKSRKDIDAELHGEGETLARHEKQLLNLAKSMNISIGKIYREIVSGDSILERPIVQELLHDVEKGLWAGVLVVEVERLARGNTMDQGIVTNSFTFSNTKIITPGKIYDPNNEFDEEYFEFGLFMSRREYKTIKRRLHNGILSSVNEGKFVSGTPPYGYERYKLKNQKGHSLKIKEDEANVIRLIFKLYLEGNGLQSICNVLNSRKIPSPSNSTWIKSSIRAILRKEVYIGKIKYIDKKYIKKIVDGKITKVINPDPSIIITDGLHEPIIDIETWNKVQTINKSHLKTPTTHIDKTLKNPLSSILICKKCGKPLRRVTDTRRNNQNMKNVRLVCVHCNNISSSFNVVEDKLLSALSDLLRSYKLQSIDNFNNELDIQLKVLTNRIQQTYSEIDLTEKQKLKIFDLLEQGIYTNEIFLERSQQNASKLAILKDTLNTLEKEKNNLLKLNNNQKNIVPRIENIIQTYYKTNNAQEKNDLLKTAIAKVEYLKENPKSPDDFELTIYPLF